MYSVLFIHKAMHSREQGDPPSGLELFRVSEGGFCADADAGMMVCGRCYEVTQAVFDA
jgi:hypothetical protein